MRRLLALVVVVASSWAAIEWLHAARLGGGGLAWSTSVMFSLLAAAWVVRLFRG